MMILGLKQKTEDGTGIKNIKNIQNQNIVAFIQPIIIHEF